MYFCNIFKERGYVFGWADGMMSFMILSVE